MSKKKKICYLVKWGNGFVGGFNERFEQLWNGSEQCLIDDLRFYHVENIKIVDKKEFDELRGFSMPTLDEYLQNCGKEPKV